MRTPAISLKTNGAIAALALATVACGGSDAAEPAESGETATTETVTSASTSTDTDPVVDSVDSMESMESVESVESVEVAAADPEAVSNDDDAADTSSTVGTAAAPATGVASTEQTDSGSCSTPESTGLAVEVGVVARFDNEVGQNAEGIAFDAAGNTYVSFAQLGQIVRLGADAADHEVVGEIPGWDDPFPGLGGIAFDATGNLYAAVGGGATSGVWLFECGQGEPTRIAGTESIGLPNALVFDDLDNLYITDSNSGVADDETPLGAVWRISAAGEVDRWAEDVQLGGTGAIGIGPIGANGVAINGDQIYVAVTEQNSIVEISILDDGSAGPISVLATSNMIEFVEGVAVASNGTVFAVEAWSNSVATVGADGSITPIAAGVDGNIDQPANIVIGTGPDDSSVLYVTNNARFSNLDGGIGSSIVAISAEPA